TGQFFPIYYLDIEVTDLPIETREAVQVDVRIHLGKHLAPDGTVDRLISEAWTEVSSNPADGRRRRLGGTHKQAVFTRPDPDPEKRKVRVLHPSLGLGDLPRRQIRPFTREDLVIGSIHCVPGPDRPLTGAPAAVVQLYARKSLPSSSRSDKNG